MSVETRTGRHDSLEKEPPDHRILSLEPSSSSEVLAAEVPVRHRCSSCTERFRQVDFGHMDDEMMFDDPQTYTNKRWASSVAAKHVEFLVRARQGLVNLGPDGPRNAMKISASE